MPAKMAKWRHWGVVGAAGATVVCLGVLGHYWRAGSAEPEEWSCIFKDQAAAARWRCVCRSVKVDGLVPHLSEVVFSANLQRVAYTACLSFDEAPDHVVVDGRRGRRYDEVCCIVFSPDSQSVAYTACKADEYFVVVDGVEGTHYEGDILEIVFSPDSNRLAYSSEKSDKEVLILDGRELAFHDYISNTDIVFSPDSSHLAYAARDGEKWGGLLDGKRMGQFDELHTFSLKFSPDSSKVGYACRRGQDSFVVYGEETYGPYDEVDGIFLVVRADSGRVAFPARRGAEWFLICGGKAYGGFAWRPRPVFSPDSKSIAVLGGWEKDVAVYLNEELVGTFSGVFAETFSPDSRHFAFGAGKDGSCVLIEDGKTAAECDGVSEVFYSPDSARLAAVLRRGSRECLFEGGREGKLYDRITWQTWDTAHFSVDSKHLAYWGQRGSEDVLVIDGLETLRFAEREPELVFTEDNHLYGVGWHIAEEGRDVAEGRGDTSEEMKKLLLFWRLTFFNISPLGEDG